MNLLPMANTYYITQSGKQAGPYQLDEIANLVGKGRLDLLDYVYDENSLEWRLIMEFPDLQPILIQQGILNLQTKSLPAQEKQNTDPENGGWFILHGSSQLGPYSTADLIRMLQTKRLFEYDLVCKSGYTEWKRLGDCEDFSPEKIKNLFSKEHKAKSPAEGEAELLFFRRRHARTPYNSSVILHNNKQVWKGTSVEISQGGAGVILHSDQLEIGQNVFLHFKPGDDIPPFNAISLLVSRRIMPDKSFKYGLKFTNINQSVQLAIRNFAEAKVIKDDEVSTAKAA